MESLPLEIQVDPALVADPSAGPTHLAIRPGEEFILDTSTLEPEFRNKVGALKLKLLEVQEAEITLQVLADQRMDGNFYPRDPVETLILTDHHCIGGYPLVMDVFYHYCFEVIEEEHGLILQYAVEAESTLPPP